MERIFAYIPEEMSSILKKLSPELMKSVCEVRLRREAPLSLTTYRKNLFVTKKGEITLNINEGITSSLGDVMLTVNRFCSGSVYRYMNSINSGYIVTKDGIRVGVCGEKTKDSAVGSFSSVNIRLHRNIENAGDVIAKYVYKNPSSSILIYSPPGVGKTTVLRSLCQSLSKGRFGNPMRISVIDERGEILLDDGGGLIDRFLGYSKPLGIEIATRLFSPEYIVCDEIGLADDTRALISVQNSGVPFIATTHSKELKDVFSRPNIRELIENRIFNTFVKLVRTPTGCESVFETTDI